MRLLPLLLLLAGTAGAGPSLDEILARTDRSAAGRLVSLAGRLHRLGQQETAARIYARALEFDPDNAAARAKLNYRRSADGWARDPDGAREVLHREDKDPARALEMREEAVAVEEWRAREVVRICGKYAAPAQARPVLRALLDRTPRLPEIHEALGHARIDGRYARSELDAFARALGEREGAWRGANDAPVTVETPGRRLEVPGLSTRPWLREVGGRLVATAFEDPWPDWFARQTERPHRLMRVLLGDEARQWIRSPTLFVGRNAYAAILRKLYPDAADYKRHSRWATHHHKSFWAVRADEGEVAIDTYAHSVAFYTLQDLASPAKPGGAKGRDRDVYSWAKEGFGYLVSLECVGTATTWFASTNESSEKIRYTLPPPEEKSRDACHAWLRTQLEDDRAPTLREVCGRSLNNLDFLASLQAYTFVRFLFLWDPEAARTFPGALRSEVEGTQIERTDRALRASFGLGLDELAQLWRAYVLELL